MMMRRRVLYRALMGVGLALVLTRHAYAAGALLVNGAGEPLRWNASVPVPFHPDQGPLGQLDNAGATTLVMDSLGIWEAVPTSDIRFANAGVLPVDVTANNVRDILGVCDDGLSPVIFDTDGSITDLLFGLGAGNRILGFAGPECGSYVPPVITEGVAVLNGRFIDGIGPVEVALEAFIAVFVHEFGHYVNLDHTQINLREAFDSNSANDVGVPTMFPMLVNGVEQRSLHLDDRVSVSTLYPHPDYFLSTGAISGRILLSDGASPFQGANVIARNIANPLLEAVSNVSGARFVSVTPGGPPPAELKGLYEIAGLSPQANYTVEIEQINPAFIGASSVGPVDPPAILPGPPEFWNGESESSDQEIDDPSAFVVIQARIGEDIANIDILINRESAPAVFHCIWGLYLDDGGTNAGEWDAYLTLSNPNDAFHSFTISHFSQNRQVVNTITLAPNETAFFSCEVLGACNFSGGLLVSSEAPLFGGVLFLSNLSFGSGTFSAQTPVCLQRALQ